MSWVQPPKYPEWSFSRERPDLIKVVIDLRAPMPTPNTAPPQMVGLGNLRERFEHASQLNIQRARQESTGIENKKPQSAGIGSTSTRRTGLFDPNNPPWLHAGDVKRFGDRPKFNIRYFGGPIYDRNSLQWSPTFFTRASGEVVGAEKNEIPIPFNMGCIVKSVAIMKSPYMTQTAVWIAPRFLIATLHLYHWRHGKPTVKECESVREDGDIFLVESEITAQILSEDSPKVQLLAFDVDDDIGIFHLMDGYPSSTNYIDPAWIIERDMIQQMNLPLGRKVACLGYNGRVDNDDVEAIMKEATRVTQENLGPSSTAVPLDVDSVLKPQMKSFSPGTLDRGNAYPTKVELGVSASVWKGGSGGPCVLLDEDGAGGIIGLVQGHASISDPVNIINAFPNGLKKAIEDLRSGTPVPS